ncbi:MAG: T9SS type A sorting domain-containing protein, partial [Saprospiraceae bacterium]|nr:T9SS type A sorting domain-containing protein [Saprospiraceae bacterium]
PGTICCNQTICEGQVPALITSSLAPSGGSGTLHYMWMQYISIGGAPPQWVAVPGAMGPTYQPGPLFETTRFMRCVRRDGCTDWVETNYVEITVLPAGSPGCTSFILDFTVNQHGSSSVQVEWTTLPEATEYLYTVQHSTNLQQWTNVGSQLGKQDQLNANTYSFMHERPANGINYYRIKRATASGQIAFSDHVEISVAFGANENVKITPNPVVSKVKIMNMMEFDKDVTIEISTTKGDVLHTVTLEKGKLQEVELDMVNLPSGVYMARIRFADGTVKTLKLTKV